MMKLLAGVLALVTLVCASPAFAEQATGYTRQVSNHPMTFPVTPLDGLPTASVPFSVTSAPTVTAASAYASGNVVGGLLTITGALRSTGTVAAGAAGLGTALLQHVQVNFKSAQTGQVDLLVFSANPTNSTFTDKTTLSLATADFDKVLGVIHVADCTSEGTPSSCQASNLSLPVRNAAGTTIWVVAVTRGTPTFTATSDVSITLDLLQ